MNFEEWYNRFIIGHPQNLTTFTLKELLQKSFYEGIFQCQMSLPKFGVNTETGEIVHLPTDDERDLPEDGVWMFDDSITDDLFDPIPLKNNEEDKNDESK